MISIIMTKEFTETESIKCNKHQYRMQFKVNLLLDAALCHVPQQKNLAAKP